MPDISQLNRTSEFPLISAAGLPSALAPYEHSVIHCTASWNSKYDGEMRTLLGQATPQFPALGLFSIDTDDTNNFDFLRSSGIQTLPCLLLYRGNELFRTVQGLPTRGVLTTALERLTETPTEARFADEYFPKRFGN